MFLLPSLYACISPNPTTVHSEKDERWLWRVPVFGDFVAHCAVPRDSKLEKGSKKGPKRVQKGSKKGPKRVQKGY